MTLGPIKWRKCLRTFLVKRFPRGELRLFVDDNFADLIPDIRWGGTSTEASADLITALVAQDRLPELWPALRADLERFDEEIAAIRRRWEADRHPRGLDGDLDPVAFATHLDEDALLAIAREVGLDDQPYIGRGPFAWPAVIGDATAAGVLDHLLLAATDRAPGLAASLPAPPRTGPWYQHPEPTECTFVGPRAKHAVIDRAGLRSGLQEFRSDDSRVIVVTGNSRTGKSYSWRLIQHVCDNLPDEEAVDAVLVSTHTWERTVTADEVAEALSQKLLGRRFEAVSGGELPETRARKIVEVLVGSLRGREHDSWIVLDGFDRKGVAACARELVVRLVDAVEAGELDHTRLVVTGLAETLSGDTADGVFLEQLRPLGRDDVEAFFTATIKHLRIAADDRVGELTDDAMGAGSDLLTLRQRASELAQGLVAP